MLRLTLIVLLVAVAVAMDWEEFKIAFAKTYKPGEESIRREIYHTNLILIERHNAEARKGHHTFQMGVNKFTDMTMKEVQTRRKGLMMRTKKSSAPVLKAPPSTSNLPDHVDWRQKGWVTPVKDQGDCGSCWAFTTTGAIEGQHKNKTGKLVSLSEEQLLDCADGDDTHGCLGGLMDGAFQYIIKNQGIDTEASYPYDLGRRDCAFNSSTIGATISSYVDVEHGSEKALQVAVATVGPVAVGIHSRDDSFHNYRSGIYSKSSCSTTDLDHAVLVVGYGTLKGQDYWLVKNSWGTDWGMQGYFMLARNKDNMCGIASVASYPLS